MSRETSATSTFEPKVMPIIIIFILGVYNLCVFLDHEIKKKKRQTKLTGKALGEHRHPPRQYRVNDTKQILDGVPNHHQNVSICFFS